MKTGRTIAHYVRREKLKKTILKKKAARKRDYPGLKLVHSGSGDNEKVSASRGAGDSDIKNKP